MCRRSGCGDDVEQRFHDQDIDKQYDDLAKRINDCRSLAHDFQVGNIDDGDCQLYIQLRRF